MSIDFTKDGPSPRLFKRFALSGAHSTSIYWSNVFTSLREESPWKGCGHAITDTKFLAWLKDTWKITIILSNSEPLVGFITAVEIDDDAYTMLLLRFPIQDW